MHGTVSLSDGERLDGHHWLLRLYAALAAVADAAMTPATQIEDRIATDRAAERDAKRTRRHARRTARAERALV